MKIVSICNQKGGVGKTTTAINLPAYLSQKGFKVLLIDMDPQANATSGLGVEKSNLPKSIYSVLLEQVSLEEAILKTKIDNLYIIPSTLQLAGATIELISSMGREQKLKKAIDSLTQPFDFIFIDCPPSLGILTINALVASNSALIPMQCEYYAMEGLSQLLNTVELVKKNLNPNLAVEGVLLTMADYRTRLTNEIIEETKKVLGEKVYNVIIPRAIRLSEAPGYGEPIMKYDKNSQGAMAYSQLAEEFISHNSNNNNMLQQNNQPQIQEESKILESTIKAEETGG